MLPSHSPLSGLRHRPIPIWTMLLDPLPPWMLDQAKDPAIVNDVGFVQMFSWWAVSNASAPHFCPP
jgi:hypothetical protein